MSDFINAPPPMTPPASSFLYHSFLRIMSTPKQAQIRSNWEKTQVRLITPTDCSSILWESYLQGWSLWSLFLSCLWSGRSADCLLCPAWLTSLGVFSRWGRLQYTPVQMSSGHSIHSNPPTEVSGSPCPRRTF